MSHAIAYPYTAPNTAPKKNTLEQQTQLTTATVLHAYSHNYTLALSAEATEHHASLAPSCLLAPQAQDTVLVACLDAGQYVILAVLFRVTTDTASVLLPHNTTMECQDTLTVRSAHSLNLESGTELSLRSDTLDATAATIQARAMSVNTIFDTVETCCRHLTNMGQTAVSAFKNFTQCLGESKKMVAGTDENHSKNTLLVAEENVTTATKNSITLAGEVARTDAKLIQLG